MKSALFIGLSIFAITSRIYSQPRAPEIGEPIVGVRCPDFLFKNVDFFKKSEVGLKDFKGKWLILDFWSKYCSGCIGSFPKISQEQEEFKDSVQFLMVTYNDQQREHRSLYAHYHDKLNLAMPCAYDGNSDSTGIFKRFNVGLLPHVIVVDPKGVVRAVTLGLTADKLLALMNGKNPPLLEASYADGKENLGKLKYDPKVPFLVSGNGGKDSCFLYRSLLSMWRPTMPFHENLEFVHGVHEDSTWHDKGRFEQLCIPLNSLYLLAYFGKRRIDALDDDTVLYGRCSPVLLLHLKDSSLFGRFDIATGENLYCYSLVVPLSKAHKEYMMQVMQRDLKNYFGYEVDVDSLNVLCWKLIVKDWQRAEALVSKGGPSSERSKQAREGVVLKNVGINRLIRWIVGYTNLTADGTPLIDETGIRDKIDFESDWVKGDLGGVLKTLRENGFDIVKGERKMKVLVLTDPEDKKW